ncbi:MAG: diaminopimelate decarboxylase [Nocardioidaceae bacterium]|nr:diaminopimelate decarboxylase [Nocardioidaceae bacterium]
MAPQVPGALQSDAETRVPRWLRAPADPNPLIAPLWPVNVDKSDEGTVRVDGVDVRQLAEEFGTPLFVVDEADFRARARAFRDAFAPADVYYAGKAFLSLAIASWVADEGLRLEVCSGGELALAVRAGFDPALLSLHGNNKSTAELTRAVELGVGHVIVDSFVEIERLGAIASAAGVRQPVLIRVTTGVEAHTHAYIATAHEDQKFGFSIAGGVARVAMERVQSHSALELVGLHCHIGSQIFDTSGFEVAARRVLALYAEGLGDGTVLGELNLGGGFGIAYTTQDDPATPHQLAAATEALVERECLALGIDIPHLSIEPGRAIAGPSTFTLYEVGTVKRVALDAGSSRLYVAVDGGMSDNIRAALYVADYSCTLASRRSNAPAILARVVGKHCEAGDIVVRDEFLPADVRPGDLLAVPATGAYCRSLASNYNHVPRPAVVAVRDGVARVIVRRETEEDLLRLEVE